MLRDVSGGAPILSAQGQTLDRADDQEQDRCGHAQCRIGWQQTDKEGGKTH